MLPNWNKAVIRQVAGSIPDVKGNPIRFESITIHAKKPFP
jgi:hypothetical protein